MKTTGSLNGTTVTLFTSGPFTVTMTCTDDGSNTSSVINASSTEDQSDLNGTFADANTPTDTGADVEPTPGRHAGLAVRAGDDRAGGAERRVGDRHRNGRRREPWHDRVLGRLHRGSLEGLPERADCGPEAPFGPPYPLLGSTQ